MAYKQGPYTIINPAKYVGSKQPYARSSWETAFMNHLDTSQTVVQWASEEISIDYINPVTRRLSKYFPDFLVVYVDKRGKQHCELIEIKPLKETYQKEAKSIHDKIALIINMAKWKAAAQWCAVRGIYFRILTENDSKRRM